MHTRKVSEGRNVGRRMTFLPFKRKQLLFIIIDALHGSATTKKRVRWRIIGEGNKLKVDEAVELSFNSS